MELTRTAHGANPLSARDRAAHIDVVRGVAVFGLLWSNLNAGTFAGELTTADVAARWASAVFSAGKFFTLFALLFGVTLAMQLERAEATGSPVGRRWLRRMVALFGIGWAHALLFWPGDILREYALAGVVLVLFRRASNRIVLAAAIITLVLGGSRESLSVLVTRVAHGDVQAAQQREQPNAEQEKIRRDFGQAMQHGSYVDAVRARLRLQVAEWERRASVPVGPLNWIQPWYLGLFLIGLVLGRKHLVQQPQHHRGALGASAVAAFAVGIPLNVAVAAPGLLSPGIYWPVDVVAKLVLGLGYLAGLLWLLTRSGWGHRLQWLAPAGRLGLTNYIMQTAFVSFIKFNYGLGLNATLGWFACLVIAVAFFLLQVVVSGWWVHRFSFGPIEWVWRRLSYGVAPPLRLSGPQAV